jgi:hypothetical protein
MFYTNTPGYPPIKRLCKGHFYLAYSIDKDGKPLEHLVEYYGKDDKIYMFDSLAAIIEGLIGTVRQADTKEREIFLREVPKNELLLYVSWHTSNKFKEYLTKGA